ncbi:hypothetical protein [Symbiopectobacterium sp. RP]|uniref:hypothetical protein n=1 Tax=Symbiopectobacterium sp. RP TaxID=3248553 RepID=UPI003D2BCC00
MEIGETSVIITRTAKLKRKDKNTGRRVKVQPGVALTLRLVVVHLTDTHAKFIGRCSQTLATRSPARKSLAGITGAGVLNPFLSC